MTHYIIGIDIGKGSFETALLGPDQKSLCHAFPNTEAGFARFEARHERVLGEALVILEATGGYETALLTRLLAQGVQVHRVAPLQARHYLRSRRVFAKTDLLDAQGLAFYELERHGSLRREVLTPEHEVQLKQWFTRREDLVAMRAAERQRLKHPTYAGTRPSVEDTIAFLSGQIADIEARMAGIVESHPRTKAVYTTLLKVAGVGPATALTLIATLPELGQATRKQIASLAGCAPHPKDSGRLTAYRSTRGGRACVKRALFMAAMSARQHNPELKAFNERLRQNGKKPIVALTATMRKLITILNAKVRDEVYATSG